MTQPDEHLITTVADIMNGPGRSLRGYTGARLLQLLDYAETRDIPELARRIRTELAIRPRDDWPGDAA